MFGLAISGPISGVVLFPGRSYSGMVLFCGCVILGWFDPISGVVLFLGWSYFWGGLIFRVVLFLG